MKSFAIVITIFASLLALAFAYFMTPSVFSVRSARGVTVHCEVLHDYPSDVARIEIVDEQSGKIVWRVKARGEMFQLHNFDLVPGLNTGTLRPFRGDFEQDIPAHGPFDLKRGIRYRASVCSADWLPVCRNASFTL